MGKKEACNILVGKPEGKGQIRPTSWWNDSNKTGLTKIRCGDMDWIHVAQDKKGWRVLLNTVINLSF
jgi:hypothetical protein